MAIEAGGGVGGGPPTPIGGTRVGGEPEARSPIVPLENRETTSLRHQDFATLMSEILQCGNSTRSDLSTLNRRHGRRAREARLIRRLPAFASVPARFGGYLIRRMSRVSAALSSMLPLYPSSHPCSCSARNPSLPEQLREPGRRPRPRGRRDILGLDCPVGAALDRR